MKLFKRTLTTAVAVCLALQSAVVCFGAEAEEQIPAGGEEVGLYTSENDEAISVTCKLTFKFTTDAGILEYLNGKSFQVKDVWFCEKFFGYKL